MLITGATGVCLQMLSRARHDAADDVSVQPYTEMQKSMMDELEKRRSDWEKEMQRMQEDFFKVISSPSICIAFCFFSDFVSHNR